MTDASINRYLLNILSVSRIRLDTMEFRYGEGTILNLEDLLSYLAVSGRGMEKIQSPRKEMKTLYILLVRCAIPKGFPDIESRRYHCTEVDRKDFMGKNKNKKLTCVGP